jgi:hypothetical protein
VDGKEPYEVLDNLYNRWRIHTGETLCVMKALNRGRDLTGQQHNIHAYFKLLPEVVAWMRRSACRRGASTALGMIIGQNPEVDLDAATKAYAGRSRGDQEINHLASIGAPFADRVLSVVDLDIHQGSRVAPGDPLIPKAPVDRAPSEYFKAARFGDLTTYDTATFALDFTQVPKYEGLTNAEKMAIASRYTPIGESPSSSDDESIPDVNDDGDPEIVWAKRQSLMLHGLRPTRHDEEASSSAVPRSAFG